MRKGVLAILTFTIIVALYGLNLSHDKCIYQSKISSLLLENIEALAAYEDGTDDGENQGGRVTCIGIGSLDCPLNHKKVECVIRGYSY